MFTCAFTFVWSSAAVYMLCVSFLVPILVQQLAVAHWPTTPLRIPDIIRHMADVIVQAEKEVFLATSAYKSSCWTERRVYPQSDYWEASSAGATISDALRHLSKRVGERKGQKVIVKLMYDRGTPKQVDECTR
jgi:hypothetical protein